jgi:hypothetical protein
MIFSFCQGEKRDVKTECWEDRLVMVEGLRQIRLMIGDTEKRIQGLCLEFSEYEFLSLIPQHLSQE